MLITPGQTLFGVSAKLLQFAATALAGEFTLEKLTVALGAPACEVRPVLAAMVDSGWVKPLASGNESFEELAPWGQLRCARIGKPLPRSQADILIAEMLDRVRKVNREQKDDHALITRVIVFGSYLNSEKQELGDLDIAYHYAYRKGQMPGPFPWDRRGKDVPNPDANVRNALKNKSPYVSLSSLWSFERLNCESREIYNVYDDAEVWGKGYNTAALFPTVFKEMPEIKTAQQG